MVRVVCSFVAHAGQLFICVYEDLLSRIPEGHLCGNVFPKEHYH